MNIHRRGLRPLLILSVLSSVFAAQAQAGHRMLGTEPGKTPRAITAASLQKAGLYEADLERVLLLIKQVAGEARQFEDRDKSAKVLVIAGDLLWHYEQDSARGIFTQAFEAATEFDKKSPGGSGLRAHIIRSIARHDDVWAEQLLSKFREEEEAKSEKQSNVSSIRQDAAPSSTVFLATASEILESNPARAAELASAALQDDVPQEIALFLYRLAKKSPVLANELYARAIARVRSFPRGLQSIRATAYLAPYPFGETRLVYSDGPGMMSITFATEEANAYPLTESLQREFLNLAFAEITAPLPTAPPSDRGEAEQLDATYGIRMWLGRSLLPKFASLQPDRARVIEDQMRVLTAQLSEYRRKSLEDRFKNSSEDTGAAQTDDPVQRILDEADSAPDPDSKTKGYILATLAALRNKDAGRAEKIVEKISDNAARDQLLAFINFDAARAALTKGDLDRARTLALKVSKIDQRAFLLAEIAEASIKRGDRARTVELLDEAEKMALKAEASTEKAFALVRVVTAYVQIDALRAFEVLGEAIATINHVPDFDFNRPLMREVSFKGWRQFFGYGLGQVSFESSLERLARADFDRTLLLAQTLDQKDLRAVAILAVSKSALAADRTKR